MAFRSSNQINALKPGKNLRRIYDKSSNDTAGLHLRIMPSGNKSWAMTYISPGPGDKRGKYRYISFGEWPEVGLSDARRMARDARGLVSQGIDPIERRKNQQADLGLGTVADLVNTYVKQLKRDGKTSWAGHVRDIADRDLIPAIGDTQARLVTEEEIGELLESVAERGLTVADHLRQAIRAMYGVGMQPRHRRKFKIESNPAINIGSYRSKSQKTRDRNLSIDEIRTLHAALITPWTVEGIRSNGRPYSQTFETPVEIRIAIMLLIYTGQRVTELIEAQWPEIDLDSGLWTIPGSRRKSRHETLNDHVVVLTPPMIKLLRELQDVQRSDYLFSNRTSTGPISRHTFRQGVSRIIKRTSLDPFQPRDLRRTWKTLAAQAGINLEMRARIQGHAISDVGSRHYDRHDYLPEKQKEMNKWSRWLSKQLEQTADNVVRLHG